MRGFFFSQNYRPNKFRRSRPYLRIRYQWIFNDRQLQEISIVFVLWRRLKGGKVLNISFMSLKQFLVDKRITIIAFCRFTCDVHCRSPWLPRQSLVGLLRRSVTECIMCMIDSVSVFPGKTTSSAALFVLFQQMSKCLPIHWRLTGRHSNETIAFRNKSLPLCFGLIWGRKKKSRTNTMATESILAGRLLGIARHQQSTPNPIKFNQVNFDQGVTYSIRWTPARL